MDAATILLIAVGLAMDAFAVSTAHGMTIQNRKVATGLVMAGSFGAFQAFMPVIGWLAGLTFIELIASFDHWVAFGLLALIGGKMIYGAKEEKEAKLTVPVLLVLSVATSIDALAVGLSFSLLRVSIITPVITIGLVTFLLAFAGFSFGNKLGKFFERKVQAIGGIFLIAIGIKILLEHLLT